MQSLLAKFLTFKKVMDYIFFGTCFSLLLRSNNSGEVICQFPFAESALNFIPRGRTWLYFRPGQ